MYFLGLDVGSSSVKLSILDGESGKAVAATHYPKTELEISSPLAGWAEQHPDTWWECIKQGCAELRAKVDFSRIAAIGISYQMHGLVLVDKNQQVLRPSIIWCDSRAVTMGDEAFNALGADWCFEHLLNSPGNFTAAKLRWVQLNEPQVFAKIHKAMLPGDFIAMKLSGEINTTASGLSEGTFWDFRENAVAEKLLAHWEMPKDLLPALVPSIGLQSEVSASAAAELGLKAGTKICYRAGDQPNNAFSLNVLQPGEVAATAGTSGVIYGVTDQPAADKQSRVNTFLHVTNTEQQKRNGVLLCVNGTGRLYSWLRQTLSQAGSEPGYPQLNALAADVPVGSDGLRIYPFGNGAERIFQNRNPGAHFSGLDFNRHRLGHIVRAAQEGIVFALNLGFDVLKSLGGSCEVIRVAAGNMFLSEVFSSAFANTTGAAVELYETDGAEGAARAAALGFGYFASAEETFRGLNQKGLITPDASQIEIYKNAYNSWLETLPLN